MSVGFDASSVIGSIASRETFASSSQASNSSRASEISTSSDLSMQLAAARESAPGILSAAYGTRDPDRTLSPLFSVRKFIF